MSYFFNQILTLFLNNYNSRVRSLSVLESKQLSFLSFRCIFRCLARKFFLSDLSLCVSTRNSHGSLSKEDGTVQCNTHEGTHSQLVCDIACPAQHLRCYLE
eukprot:m.30000 g.30000  ORF g.30000 m.30000 type:complete len:101 (+) comp8161_c0_seq1:1561-1863(+)